ncbi:hypothetical protein QOZ83_00025 [Romboutsia sedimentorum]|uniref:hypothetical protein n=1 Tax=Romboutsia sedimentorum TaxID=1368474 RepID=UPI0024DED03A|nr:hypothetical protein [Romboutsia sedimentorum]MDK2584231.1 hypothetical protein [Romboutsia sedimentorum]
MRRDYKVKELMFLDGEAKLKQEIKINESFMTLILNIQKYVKDELTDIVKVDLPSDDKEALSVLNNGFTYLNEKYIYFSTSAGLMKKAETEEKYEGEGLFIKESFKHFKEFYEDVISVSKLTEKKNTKLSITKDVISRISLALTDGEFIHMPNTKYLIVSEMQYEFVNNYLQFVEKKDGSLDLDKFELEEKKNLSVEHTACDGCGYALPSFFSEVSKKISIRDEVSQVLIRQIGMATKGTLTKFDFHKYLREECNITDTEFLVKDFWGNDKNIFDYDVIMNGSMCKWAKWFNSYKEYEELIQQSKYNKVRHLYEGLLIADTNKEESKKYTQMNYQVLGNLALSEKELEQLSFESEDIYERVIKQDIDATKIMLGDIARPNVDKLSSSTKLHQQLQLDDNFINCQSMFKTVGNMINKSVNNLAGGKIYIEGSYKTLIHDPIEYFDRLIFGESKNRGLEPKTVYIPHEKEGIRTLSRSPLNSATENLNVKNVRNGLFDKYFADSTNDIIFLPFDDSNMLMSGADFDGDTLLCMTNATVYNSVIEDIDKNSTKWCFRNQLDGAEPPKFIYNDENTHKCIILGRGNAIGGLSNLGCKISNSIQTMPYKVNGEYHSYEYLIEKGTERTSKKYPQLSEKEVKEKVNKQFYNLLEKGKIQKLNDEEVKEYTYKQFQENKKYSYYTLVLQQIAIDQPKTLITVKKEQKDKLKECIDKSIKKPKFVYYAKYKNECKQVEYNDICYSNSLLNNHANRIIRKLGKGARDMEGSEYDNNAYKNLFNRVETKVKKENIIIHTKLLKKLTELNNKYHELRNSVPVKSEIKELKARRKKLEDAKVDELFINEINDALIPLYKKLNSSYDLIDVKIQEAYDEHIKSKYSDIEILYTLGKVRSNKTDKHGNKYRVSSRFCIEFCFEEISAYLRNEKSNVVTGYELDAEGEVHYLFENYCKVDKPLENKDLTKEQRLKQEIKLGLTTEVRISLESDCREITDTIIVENDNVINQNGEVLGKFYDNFKNVLDNNDYKLRDYKIDKSNRGMSIFIKVA